MDEIDHLNDAMHDTDRKPEVKTHEPCGQTYEAGTLLQHLENCYVIVTMV